MAHDELMFQDAVAKKLFARLALDGPTGAGKTFTALLLMQLLVKGEQFGAVDTENKTMAKYLRRLKPSKGGKAPFKVIEMGPPYSPERLIKIVDLAEEMKLPGLIVDSWSHFWRGPGGTLDQVEEERAQAEARGNRNEFAAWKEPSKEQSDMVERLIRFQGHLIVCMRSKMAYEQVVEGGKKKVVRLGLKPIQRAEVEYEFDVYGSLDRSHTLVITKTRCEALDNKSFKKPEGPEIVKPLLKWLNDGEGEPVSGAQPPLLQTSAEETGAALAAQVEGTDPFAADEAAKSAQAELNETCLALQKEMRLTTDEKALSAVAAKIPSLKLSQSSGLYKDLRACYDAHRNDIRSGKVKPPPEKKDGAAPEAKPEQGA